jgi:CRISPR/Cas system-associated endoribonuclease Cas2
MLTKQTHRQRSVFGLPINGAINEKLSIRRLPQIARTKDAKLIMGIDLYNFNDGEANGPPKPHRQRSVFGLPINGAILS